MQLLSRWLLSLERSDWPTVVVNTKLCSMNITQNDGKIDRHAIINMKENSLVKTIVVCTDGRGTTSTDRCMMFLYEFGFGFAMAKGKGKLCAAWNYIKRSVYRKLSSFLLVKV